MLWSVSFGRSRRIWNLSRLSGPLWNCAGRISRHKLGKIDKLGRINKIDKIGRIDKIGKLGKMGKMGKMGWDCLTQKSQIDLFCIASDESPRKGGCGGEKSLVDWKEKERKRWIARILQSVWKGWAIPLFVITVSVGPLFRSIRVLNGDSKILAV